MITRALSLNEFIKRRRSIFLFGARGTGKTSLLRQSLPRDAVYIDLLESSAFHRYMADSSLFAREVEQKLERAGNVLLVAIDEVQKLPWLLDDVHRLIEKYKPRLFFFLSGSSARKLKRGGANLLAGRAITKHLYPLSSLEIELNLDRSLQFGTLPAVYLEDGLEVATLETYVNTYLREEILEESLVRQLERFSRFLELAAQLNGEPIQAAKLGKQLNTSHHTVADYYSILSDTLVANRLDGWSESVKRQLLQAPKFYFFDCGVLNAINGELRSQLRSSSYRFGRLFETFVIQEIIRRNSYRDLGLQFHYWREKQGREVDLIVSRSRSKPLLAIEIKSHSKPDADDLVGMRLIAEDYRKIPCWCLCLTPRAYREGNIEVQPWQEGLERLDKV